MWYASLRSMYGDTVNWAPDDPRNIVEVFLTKGSTISMDDMVGSQGLVQTAVAHVSLVVSLADENPSNDQEREYAGMMPLVITKPLSEWQVLANTCVNPPCSTSDAHQVLLYTWFRLTDYVAADVPSPKGMLDSNMNGSRRILATKAISGIHFTDASTGSSTLSTSSSTFQSAVRSIMKHLPSHTNCFPELGLTSGCTGTITYASGRYDSTVAQCSDAFKNTSCVKSFKNDGPSRFLLSLESTPKAAYSQTSGSWVENSTEPSILYTLLSGGSGVRVPSSTPCFPMDGCVAGMDNRAFVHRVDPKPSDWVLWVLAGVACILVFVIIWMHHRHTKRTFQLDAILHDMRFSAHDSRTLQRTVDAPVL